MNTENVTQMDRVVIDHDIDALQGEVRIAGSLLVQGDIKSEARVTVDGDLEVQGNVEDAVVEAKGSVVLRKGFIGLGKGTIKAGGDVTVHHVLNQTVISGADIHLDQESVNGKLKASGSIVAPLALISGGLLEAEREIEVKTLGRAEAAPAHVIVGKRARLLDRIGQVERECQHAVRQLGEVKEAVFKLVRLKLDQGTLDPAREQSLAKLQQAQQLLPQRVTMFEEEKASLAAELAKMQESRLLVHDSVLESTFVEINGARRIMDMDLQGVIFLRHGGNVEFIALES